MFNFLDSKLTPKIVCKSPATDHYEVDNLVSNDYAKKMRGFLAYSAIKPPVEIEIEFICPINIHYIILNTTVGSQKCSGIEIFAKTSFLNYTSICKSVYEKTGIVFCNSRKYSKSNLPLNCNPDYHLAFFKSNTFKNFLNANSIKIVIFRTEKSVPCLASAEIWGTTSRSCSETTSRTIKRIMEKPATVSGSAFNITKDEFNIPEDFKDDLTYEIMTIPMTLPSGKTVDQSTLDKHINSEISFGRKPCDPFTGVKFNEKLKPVLNVALKSRIDMFILQNSHRQELLNVKRTLGRASNYYSSSSNQSSENSCKKRKFNDANDLDEAVLIAKSNPNFINFSSENIDTSACSNCHKQFNSLYEIPCKHRYCRICLLEVCNVLECSLCRKIFVKSDVKKCNL